MQSFGKGFGKAICQGLKKNILIIIMRRAEAGNMRINAVNADGKAAHPIAIRADKVGKAHIGAIPALADLLAQEAEGHMPLFFGQMNNNIIPITGAGPKADHTARRQPFFGNDRVEHLIGIGKKVARTFPNNSIVENCGISPMQFPSPEERRPIDHAAQILKAPGIKDMQARLRGRRRLMRHACNKAIGARIGKGKKHAGFLACTHIAHMLIIRSSCLYKAITLRV